MPPRTDGPPELSAERFGVEFSQHNILYGGHEWDDDSRSLAGLVLKSRCLTKESYNYISFINTKELKPEDRRRVEKDYQKLQPDIGEHYLCRIFLQARAAAESKSLLILSEEDLTLLREIGTFLHDGRIPTPFAFPDLTDHVINSDDFACGLLNFSPPDALSLAAVREDATVRRYAGKINSLLGQTASQDKQRSMLQAMKEAHEQANVDQRVKTIFEIESWVVKPLHYVPFVGEALTIAEDLKDVAVKWLDKKKEDSEWYLVAARMTEVAIRDYLARKDNIINSSIGANRSIFQRLNGWQTFWRR